MSNPRSKRALKAACVLIGGCLLLGAALAWRARAVRAAEDGPVFALPAPARNLPVVRLPMVLSREWSGAVSPLQVTRFALARMAAGETYEVSVALLAGDLRENERLAASFTGPSGHPIQKELHAGDPNFFFHYRPDRTGAAALSLYSTGRGRRPLPARVSVIPLGVAAADRPAIEAEPNDSWQQANSLVLGRAVYGSADDVDYLDNRYEGRAGLDWFRIEFAEEQPRLVYFELDLLDRDISPNLKLYRLNEQTQSLEYYIAGKDPMEIIHDRQEFRYSKFITRVLRRGTYFLQVNANHPHYVLRTTVYPVPPYQDVQQAVLAASHYIVNIGDAWFAQTPRNGDVYARRSLQHDATMRCTACHPTVFSTESMLVAKRHGYPISAKAQYQYLLDRIYNAPAPLYGLDGVYFLRFIGIALQAMGKQGGVAAEHEALVGGGMDEAQRAQRYTRWSNYVKHAWSHRRTVADLPDDEPNGVVPIDSSFGFALRDWRVLREQVRRTGDGEAAAAADNIRAILTSSASRQRVKNMQDRVLRLQAMLEMEREQHAGEIQSEIAELFRLQNPDGGWADGIKTVSSDGTHSAEYLTGQIACVLMQAGLRPETEPRLDKALRWLLARQKAFGGWFQTGDTGENFQTPMRETRYAVESLAKAFPRPFRPGWENRNGQPARVPAPGTASLRETLDALDSIWELDDAERDRLLPRIAQYLDSRHPALLRAISAACLARVGDERSVEPLARHLGDPVRMVSQAVAYALRRLGNRGIGMEAIARALRSPSPLVRRGATRVFAYQFYGMDTRLDLAGEFFPLLADPDLLTRLSASRTLTQWWYRTGDLALKKRIVEAVVARMAVEGEHAVMQQNLQHELYVLMDEHLPRSSINIDRWSAYLAEPLKSRVRAGREQVERDVLLAPVFAGLARGSAFQRRALLAAFDGSPWRQRSYARYPYTAADIGNDREFLFLYQPPQSELDALFAHLFRVEDQPAARRQALQLGQFFQVPSKTESAEVKRAFLEALEHPDAGVRRAAREILAKDLMFGANTSRPVPEEVLPLLYRALESADTETRRAVVDLALRLPAVLADSGARIRIRETLESAQHRSAALEALKTDVLEDAEAATVLARAWDAETNPEARIRLLKLLESREGLLKEPRREALLRAAAPVVHRAAADESSLVREQAYRLMSAKPALRDEALLRRGLEDSSASVRLASLRALEVPEDMLLRLALDRDRAVRLETMKIVEKRGLARDQRLARRIRALSDDDDAEVRQNALRLLRANGWDPSALDPDARLERESAPDFYFFKDKVNAFFYRAGLDGLACANCHATHDILRIVEPHPDKSPLTDEEVRINYRSALKVIDLKDIEQSLILRKPRSPYGQGEASAESPTGVTHVGGDRWTNSDSGMYYTLVQWIRGARLSATSR